jgi:hypothetical protein
MPTIEGICNQALDVIGYVKHIGNIYEGTKAATIALSAWGETRDELLITMKPDWAKRDIPLTLLKSAPRIVNNTADYTGVTWSDIYPEVPWLYEYAYPSDVVEVMQIKAPPQFLPQWRPRYIAFRLNYDAGAVNARTILTNQQGAILNYVSMVLDPNSWQTDFIGMMIMALAKKFHVPLGMPEPQQPRQQQQQQEGRNADASG